MYLQQLLLNNIILTMICLINLLKGNFFLIMSEPILIFKCALFNMVFSHEHLQQVSKLYKFIFLDMEKATKPVSISMCNCKIAALNFKTSMSF